MPLSGFMAPVTLVGSLVQHTAETLSGVVISQLASPGAPALYGGSPAIFDIRYETTPMGAVETMMIDCAYSEIGKHLGLPTQAYIGLSDAKQLDAQAGLETSMGATLAALAGINSVSGPGHAGLRELPEPGEAGGRQRDLRHGAAPGARHRAQGGLPGAAASSRNCSREKHLLIAEAHPAPPEAGALLPRAPSSTAPTAPGGRTRAARRSASGRTTRGGAGCSPAYRRLGARRRTSKAELTRLMAREARRLRDGRAARERAHAP